MTVTANLAFAVASCAIGSSFQVGYNTGVINAPGNIIKEWYRTVYRSRYGILTNRNESRAVTHEQLHDVGTDVTSEMLPDDTIVARVKQLLGETMVTPGEQLPDELSKSQLDFLWSITVSIFCTGGMLGAVSAAFCADKFGRKGTLLLNNVLAVVAAALFGLAVFANSHEMLIIGRFIIGLNSGIGMVTGPMYLTEIAPVSIRGALGSMHQLLVTSSILISQVLGLPMILGNENGWPLLLALTLIPAIYQLVTLPFCPESPKFLLIVRQQTTKAQTALIKLRQTSEVYDELDEMKHENQRLLKVARVHFKDLFVNRALCLPLMITVVLNLAQQLSGINAIFFYSTRIFTENAKMTQLNAVCATIGMGATNVVMAAMFLMMVEKVGRRTWLLTALGGTWVATILLTVALNFLEKGSGNSGAWTVTCILGIFLFIVAYGLGLAS